MVLISLINGIIYTLKHLATINNNNANLYLLI